MVLLIACGHLVVLDIQVSRRNQAHRYAVQRSDATLLPTWFKASKCKIYSFLLVWHLSRSHHFIMLQNINFNSISALHDICCIHLQFLFTEQFSCAGWLSQTNIVEMLYSWASMSSSSSSSSCHQPVHACGNRGTQIKRQILWHKLWILNTDPLCMPQVATVGTATHMHASGRSWAATTYSGFICGTYPYVVTTGARSLIWIKLPANHTIEIFYFTGSARNLPHRLSFCLT